MKRLAVILVSLLCCVDGYSQDAAEVVQTPSDSIGVTVEQMTDSLIAFAFRSLGKRYRSGSTGPDSFDCSGFTSYVFGNFGVRLSRTSREQFGNGRNVKGGFDNLQKGDLVFFNGRRVGNTVGHVGIFIEADSTGTDFSFIHAAMTGVTVSRYSEDYYSRRYMGARRVLPDIWLPLPDSIAGRTPDIQVDTTDIAGFLKEKILLLNDGTWMIQNQDGIVLEPADSLDIVLYKDGRWRVTRSGSAVLPAAAGAPSDTSVSAASVTETQPAPDVNAPAPEPEKVYHKIKSGDTLSSIARRYGTTVSKLCKLNSISAKTTLRVGKRLRVR